jgi:1-acyl-sn-glycerol-3-phosphate acyltransferase
MPSQYLKRGFARFAFWGSVFYYFRSMKWMRAGFGIFYHLWYYFVVFVAIIGLLPFIYFTSLRADTYQRFFTWARIWARLILFGLGIRVKAKFHFKPEKEKPYIICANHSSEIDIMMCLALIPSAFVFIGKKELGKLPLFGYFYKRTNILVDRKSLSSKRDVMIRAAEKIQQGIGVCIYPEGGIPDLNITLAPFKMGAFKLAIDQQIPIIPMSFPDNKRRFPSTWFGGTPGLVRAVVHKPLEVADLSLNDIHRLKEACFEQILSGLNS